MKYSIIIFFAALLLNSSLSAQVVGSNNSTYTRADTLRGSLRPERSNYDVKKYHLKLKIDPENKSISGSNLIKFEVLDDLPAMQLDLFSNMEIDSVMHNGARLDYRREYNAFFIDLKNRLQKGTKDSLEVFYHGQPVIAENAPWDGGFVWSEDKNGNPWIGVAVQGTGASLWYPNKDHQSDEPEEAQLDIAVPNGLTNVSNGSFSGKTELENGYTEWSWKVANPINNYNLIVNIGKYAHFEDSYKDLKLDYYVLEYNLEKAKKQFKEVHDMMDCFYEKMGPYPFEEDGFKLVETPYLGMEHQSAVAYGNEYKNGYLGRDLSGTGIGLNWDYIIIHESGHEWYGNSITAKDIADMWIQEGFTSYTEAIYVECRWGKQKSLEYLKGVRRGISNSNKIIGDYNVNSEGSGDMYFKGANLLNTIRSIYNDDDLWWNTLRDYTETYKHQVITTRETEAFFNKAIDLDLQPVFDQYLRNTGLPVIQLKKDKDEIYFRWKADVADFKMPVDVFINNKETRLHPNKQWKKLNYKDLKLSDIKVNDLKYYIDTQIL